MNVSVNGCLSLYDGPVIHWPQSQLGFAPAQRISSIDRGRIITYIIAVKATKLKRTRHILIENKQMFL